MQQAEQAEKAASGEAKTAALFRKLKAEVAAQRERNAGARIKSEFQAACNAYREAIASSGTDDRPDRTPAGKTGGDAEERRDERALEEDWMYERKGRRTRRHGGN